MTDTRDMYHFAEWEGHDTLYHFRPVSGSAPCEHVTEPRPCALDTTEGRARRQLRSLLPDDSAIINGVTVHCVTLAFNSKEGRRVTRARYLVGGVKYTFEQAVAAVTGQAGGREAE